MSFLRKQESKIWNSMKKVVVLILFVCLTGSLAGGGVFYWKGERLRIQLQGLQRTIQQMQEEIERVKKEEENAVLEKEKLQADSVSYLALNTKLQEGIANLQKELAGKGEILRAKKEELTSLQKKLEVMEQEREKEKAYRGELFDQQKKGLENQIGLLEQTLRSEKARYHYNLGSAYAHAKLYDEAVDSYKKSLEFDPNNAEAYYNLGVLFMEVKLDPEKAINHFRKYLELNPKSEDRQGVEEWIQRLKQ